MTVRLLWRTVPTLLCVLGALTALAPPSGAAAPDAQGWWYRARSSELPIEAPVPPTVEDDGLYVAAGPTGALAVAALRADVGDATEVVVTLQLTDTTGTVVLGACRTDPWTAVQAGSWEDRPVADCEAGAVAAVVTEDGATATIDATSLVDGGTMDLVLVPGTNEDGSPANFSASIAPPGPETVSTTSGADGSGAPPVPPSPTPPPTGSAPSSPDSPRSVLPIAPPPSDFEPASGIAPSPEPQTALEIPPMAEEVTAPVVARPALSTPGGPDSDSGRVLGLGLIAAIGASYVALRGRQGPVPVPLLDFAGRGPSTAPVAAPVLGTTTSGVGRFARQRVGRPPPLT